VRAFLLFLFYYLVVGAGPAGLQLAHFLQRGGHDHLVLDDSAEVLRVIVPAPCDAIP
jgi:2-polyprenyl-6-methoxyphenol hydroxylase-like FAD-dependent oxidoreductase